MSNILRLPLKLEVRLKAEQLPQNGILMEIIFEYNKDGKRFLYDISIHEKNEIGDAVHPDYRAMRANRPQRGRQYASADSPDGKLKAFTKDRNMYISDIDGSNVVAITTEGNDENQIKYGIATWVLW